MRAAIDVSPVAGRSDLAAFIQLPKRLYRGQKGYVAPLDMIRELIADNKSMARAMRNAHEICDKHDDVATASLLENWIDETERRTWFLFETSRAADGSGH